MEILTCFCPLVISKSHRTPPGSAPLLQRSEAGKTERNACCLEGLAQIWILSSFPLLNNRDFWKTSVHFHQKEPNMIEGLCGITDWWNMQHLLHFTLTVLGPTWEKKWNKEGNRSHRWEKKHFSEILLKVESSGSHSGQLLVFWH